MDPLQSGKPKLIRNCRLSESNLPNEAPTLVMPEGAIRLKGTGAEIVGLCDGSRSLGEILKLLKSKYPSANAGELERDTLDFLNQLREKRVLDF